ncbi:MAG: Ku protein [Verrucomicrobium sp.]|nr:Ku protein [Verrucomicrobium sp.]
MRALWKGSITFGLVTIPVGLFPATRREELSFRLLRKSDLSPVNYKRVAEADGKEVPWEEIVKGYEYEKGRFVVLREEDFKRVDIEAAAQTVDILDFVPQEEINPMYFRKPYYLEPQKGGDKAYALLREALRNSGKIGIAKVVIRAREHLAGLKAQGQALVLEIMHFADELADPSEIKLPKAAHTRPREVDMARKLIDGMTREWNPERYKDEYKEQVLAMIEEKAKHPRKKAPAAKEPKAKASGVDLVSMLERSVREYQRGNRMAAPRRGVAPKGTSTRRRAAKRKR